jgi:hypothetical protein
LKPTTLVGVVGLVVMGLIIADFLTHPSGTATAFNGLTALTVPSEQGLLGNNPTYRYTSG